MIKKRPAAPREVAAFTLFSIREEGAWSDGALHHYISRAGLDSRDAALASRLAFGVLQNRTLCEFYLKKFSSVRLSRLLPRVRDCLDLGVYQLTMLDRIPAHAAVSETVSLIRNYAHANERTVKYANGVLRAIARAVEDGSLPVLDCPTKAAYLALRYSHPEWLTQALCDEFGEKAASSICALDNETAPLCLRVNLLKTTREKALDALRAEGLSCAPHSKIENLVLCDGGSVAALPIFERGEVTVQDGASIVCVDALSPRPGELVVDLCGAPGGKTCYIAEKMGNRGHVIAGDLYGHKLERIRAAAERLCLNIIETRLADASTFQPDLEGRADRVLCDVPCSGLGVIRKKPEIRWKSEESLRGLPAIQSAILETGCRYVKPGGTLVYSTCTVLRRENLDIVENFLENHPEFTAEPFTHPATGENPEGHITLLPHLHQTDGFFIAKLRRM